ncbi:MAG: hypothetical protein HYR96_14470 [Deltaproteobacteria bacterium]|nr:hypothetical protein [Deltaproteobacteria bacterium]MBI3293697.1 hypothetical protein [Deltaproteobacteria bacterium]
MTGNRGFAPLLFAIGVVSILSISSLVISISGGIANQKHIVRLNRIDAFYTNELSAWHLLHRRNENLSITSTDYSIDNRYADSMGPADPSHFSNSELPLGISDTLSFAPTHGILPRYDRSLSGYAAKSSASCGNTRFGKRGYRLCLFQGLPPKFSRFLAPQYNVAARIDNGRLFVWGHGWSGVLNGQPFPPELRNPLLAETFECPSCRFIYVGGGYTGGIHSFEALADNGTVYSLVNMEDNNAPFLHWYIKNSSLGLPAGTKVVQVEWGSVLTNDGRIFHWDGGVNWQEAVIENGSNKFESLSETQNPFICAVTPEHRVYCRGLDGQGHRVPDGNQEVFRPLDLSGLEAGENVTAVSVHAWTSCLLTDRGNVYCWNNGAIIGADPQAFFTNETYPTRKVNLRNIPAGRRVVFMSAPTPGIVVTDDGVGYAWGESAIGNPTYCNEESCPVNADPVPIKVSHLPAGHRWKEIYPGIPQEWACGRTADNSVYCWGRNSSDQLGNKDLPVGDLVFYEPQPLGQ